MTLINLDGTKSPDIIKKTQTFWFTQNQAMGFPQHANQIGRSFSTRAELEQSIAEIQSSFDQAIREARATLPN